MDVEITPPRSRRWLVWSLDDVGGFLVGAFLGYMILLWLRPQSTQGQATAVPEIPTAIPIIPTAIPIIPTAIPVIHTPTPDTSLAASWPTTAEQFLSWVTEGQPAPDGSWRPIEVEEIYHPVDEPNAWAVNRKPVLQGGSWPFWAHNFSGCKQDGWMDALLRGSYRFPRSRFRHNSGRGNPGWLVRPG